MYTLSYTCRKVYKPRATSYGLYTPKKIQATIMYLQLETDGRLRARNANGCRTRGLAAACIRVCKHNKIVSPAVSKTDKHNVCGCADVVVNVTLAGDRIARQEWQKIACCIHRSNKHKYVPHFTYIRSACIMHIYWSHCNSIMCMLMYERYLLAPCLSITCVLFVL